MDVRLSRLGGRLTVPSLSVASVALADSQSPSIRQRRRTHSATASPRLTPQCSLRPIYSLDSLGVARRDISRREIVRREIEYREMGWREKYWREISLREIVWREIEHRETSRREIGEKYRREIFRRERPLSTSGQRLRPPARRLSREVERVAAVGVGGRHL